VSRGEDPFEDIRTLHFATPGLCFYNTRSGCAG
jgi:hypothetical protein